MKDVDLRVRIAALSVVGLLSWSFELEVSKWVFQKIVVPQNGWFIKNGKPYEQMDDLGGFTTPIFGSTPISSYKAGPKKPVISRGPCHSTYFGLEITPVKPISSLYLRPSTGAPFHSIWYTPILYHHTVPAQNGKVDDENHSTLI